MMIRPTPNSIYDTLFGNSKHSSNSVVVWLIRSMYVVSVRARG